MTTTYFVILTEADCLEVFHTEAVRDAQLCYYYEIEFDCKGYDLTVDSYQGLVEEANAYGSELIQHPADFVPKTIKETPVNYPTTVHTCTKSAAWAIAVDPANFMKVDYRLQELCPDARSWEWLITESIHPELQHHVPTMTVFIPGGYDALRRRLLAKLPQRSYDFTLIQEDLALAA